jgi:hypothetical protein
MLKFFPFEITYRKKLKNKFDDYTNDKIIEFFINDFEKSGVRNIRKVGVNKVVADIMFFAIRPGGNLNRWIGIGYGSVEIIGEIEKENRVVIYKFNHLRLMIVALVAGGIISGISLTWWMGLFAFGALGILNLIIKLIQHYVTFYEVFDELVFDRKKKENNVSAQN